MFYGSHWTTHREDSQHALEANWSTLKNLPLGSDIELRGYHFGPCGIQTMEVSQNGRVIVSYADFIENVNLGKSRMRIMSYTVFAISLIAFCSASIRDRTSKHSNRKKFKE